MVLQTTYGNAMDGTLSVFVLYVLIGKYLYLRHWKGARAVVDLPFSSR